MATYFGDDANKYREMYLRRLHRLGYPTSKALMRSFNKEFIKETGLQGEDSLRLKELAHDFRCYIQEDRGFYWVPPNSQLDAVYQAVIDDYNDKKKRGDIPRQHWLKPPASKRVRIASPTQAAKAKNLDDHYLSSLSVAADSEDRGAITDDGLKELRDQMEKKKDELEELGARERDRTKKTIDDLKKKYEEQKRKASQIEKKEHELEKLKAQHAREVDQQTKAAKYWKKKYEEEQKRTTDLEQKRKALKGDGDCVGRVRHDLEEKKDQMAQQTTSDLVKLEQELNEKNYQLYLIEAASQLATIQALEEAIHKNHETIETLLELHKTILFNKPAPEHLPDFSSSTL